MKVRSIKVLVLMVAFGATVFWARALFWPQPVAAKPAFMERYNRDPYAKAELKGKCTICHISRGGGERNEFGDAFEDAGLRFDAKLRAKYPEKFNLEPAKSAGEEQQAPTPVRSPDN